MIDEVDIELLATTNTNSVNISQKDQFIFTKKEWNEIMDHIYLGFYPGLILMMTANKDLKEFKSELRKGRVDIIHELK